MILGVGLDLVSMRRMEILVHHHRSRFLKRCFVPGEITGDRIEAVVAMARAWALKEAFLKALGGRIRDIPYREITVDLGEPGRPVLRPVGQAAAALAARGGRGLASYSSAAGPWIAGAVVIHDGRSGKGLGEDIVV